MNGWPSDETYLRVLACGALGHHEVLERAPCCPRELGASGCGFESPNRMVGLIQARRGSANPQASVSTRSSQSKSECLDSDASCGNSQSLARNDVAAHLCLQDRPERLGKGDLLELDPPRPAHGL